MAKVTAASKGPMDQYLHTEQVTLTRTMTMRIFQTRTRMTTMMSMMTAIMMMTIFDDDIPN